MDEVDATGMRDFTQRDAGSRSDAAGSATVQCEDGTDRGDECREHRETTPRHGVNNIQRRNGALVSLTHEPPALCDSDLRNARGIRIRLP